MHGTLSTPAQSAALFVSVALAFLANGLQGTLIGVRASVAGMPDEIIGLIMSSFYLGYFGGSIIAPRLVQSVGHIRGFAALASIASGIALVFPIFVNQAAWICLRMVSGVCFAGMLIIVESWLNAGTPSAKRGRVLALYGVVVYLAWAGSQPLLAIAPAAGFTLFCLVSMLFSFSLVPVTLTRAGTPGTVLAQRVGLPRLLRVSPTAVVGALSLGAAMGAFWGMAPTWGQRTGLSRESLATFLSLVLFGALAFQWPLGWLSDLVDRRIVLGSSLLASACVAAGLPLLADQNLLLLFGLGTLLGGLAMPLYALCAAHANDHVDAEEVVAVSSALILVYGAGSAAGPFLASLAMALLGAASFFGVVALWLLLAGIYAFYRLLLGPSQPRIEKVGYVSVPQTSHSALAMHRHGTGEPDAGRAPR